MRRLLAAALLAATLAGCGAEEVGAPAADVARAAYVHGGAPSLTLITVLNERSGEGAHTGLMVNGSQRVMFDPAGTFNTTRVLPERGDVLYGMTPAYYQAYVDYHTRVTFRTIEQTVEVSPEVAEAALRLVQASGPSSKAGCAMNTSAVLRQLPGFEGVGRSWFPKSIMRDFAGLPGVATRTYRDDDPDENAMKRARAL